MAAPRTLAILGAGCAGTLLARELRRQRFLGGIELLDARTDFRAEQRWCFWRDRRMSAPDVPVSHEWSEWQARDHLSPLDDLRLGWALPKRAFVNVFRARSKLGYNGRQSREPMAQTP